MRTQCPDCSTIFKISQPSLEAAEGLVRCGECGEVFNALGTLIRDPAAPAQTKPKPAQENLDLGLETLTDHPTHHGFFTDDERNPNSAVTTRSLNWLWITGTALLIPALLFQVIYWQRDALATVSSLRDPMESMCEFLSCEIKPLRDLARIELVSRNVYSHPNDEEALIISATLINNANYKQPYPIITISMANVRGKTLVWRDFTPEEYLSADDTNDMMEPGAPLNLALEVVDPGSDVMTFEIDFK